MTLGLLAPTAQPGGGRRAASRTDEAICADATILILVDNASSSPQRGSRVTVQVEATDTGVAVQRGRGEGLGLAIAKSIVTMHHGSLNVVDSRREALHFAQHSGGPETVTPWFHGSTGL
jgi:hypothetical protein